MNALKATLIAALLLLLASCSSTLAPPAADAGDPQPRDVDVATAAITQVAFSSGVNGQSGGASLTLLRPDGVAGGDFLLAQITFEKGKDVSNLVAPAGWSLVRRSNSIHLVDGSDLGQAIFSKFATSSEPTDYTWQFRKGSSPEQVRAAGGIIRYTGVDPTNPIVSSSQAAGDGITLTAPQITAEANSIIVAFYGHKKRTTLTNPVGMTGLYHQAHANQSGPTIRASQELRGAGGATGSRTSNASSSVGGDKWIAQLVGLRAAATITVNKVVVPDTDDGVFDLRVNGVTHKADAGHGDGTGPVSVSAGSVTVSELAGTATDLDDYVSAISCDTEKGSSSSASHTFTVGSGEDVTCTITNTRKATLTVTKVLDPIDDTGLFDLLIDGTEYAEDVGNGGTTGAVKLPPGTVTVSEAAGTDTVLSNYTQVFSGGCAADGTITLAAGDVATCTITNTRKATLTVNKVLSPTDDPGRFDLRIGGTAYATNAGHGGSTGAVSLVPGTYTVSETAGTATDLADYTQAISGACAAGGSITLAAGQNATCTITNTRKQVVVPQALDLFLHNSPSPPTGNTAQQAHLPLNTTAPTATTLYNYNTTNDSNAGVTGRFIDKISSSDALATTDLQKHQTWRSAALGSAVTVAGPLSLKIWAKMKSSGKNIQLRAFVRDCASAASGCTSWTQLDMASVSNASNTTFTELNLTSASVTMSVAAGRIIELRVVMLDISNSDQAYLAYDTVSYPARLTLP